MANKTDKKRFKLDGFTKVAGIYTIVTAAFYILIESLKNRGYMLINTHIEYWACFAMILGIIILITKLVVNIPKTESFKKSVRISAIVLCVAITFLTYMYTISGIKDSLRICATLVSPDEKHTVLVMRSDSEFTTDDGETNVYTLYRAYPKRNALFCDSTERDQFILIKNDTEAELKMNWLENGLELSTDGAALEDCGTLKIEF